MNEIARNNLAVLGAAQIATEERAEWDYYSTDPDCVNDLLNKEPQLVNSNFKYLEPCAGAGAIADRFEQLTKIKMDQYDIFPHKENIIQQDYMKLNSVGQYDVIITNFPYHAASKKNPIGFNQLLVKALKDIKPGGYVCSFQKLLHLESKNRYEDIYSRFKPEKIYVYVKRVKCYRGGDTEKYKDMNSTICYSWVIFHKDEKGFYSNKETKLDWIYK